MNRINSLISKIKDYSYQPKPARRTYILKKNGKKRPLGVPSADDKLVQEILKMLLESIWNSTFAKTSYGFRKNRGCHTALVRAQISSRRCQSVELRASRETSSPSTMPARPMPTSATNC